MAKRKRRDDPPAVPDEASVCELCFEPTGLTAGWGCRYCRDCYYSDTTRFRLYFNGYAAWHRFRTPDNNPGFDNAVRCLEDGGT